MAQTSESHLSEEKIVLKLGDILQFQSPRNKELHDKTFYIEYIDDAVIEAKGVWQVCAVGERYRLACVNGDRCITISL